MEDCTAKLICTMRETNETGTSLKSHVEEKKMWKYIDQFSNEMKLTKVIVEFSGRASPKLFFLGRVFDQVVGPTNE